MGGQIVEHDTNAIGFWIVYVDQFAHAFGEVGGSAVLGDLYLAPGSVHVDEHEQIGRAIASILVIEALDLSRLCRDRWPGLADELDRTLVEADYRLAARERLLRSGTILLST